MQNRTSRQIHYEYFFWESLPLVTQLNDSRKFKTHSHLHHNLKKCQEFGKEVLGNCFSTLGWAFSLRGLLVSPSFRINSMFSNTDRTPQASQSNTANSTHQLGKALDPRTSSTECRHFDPENFRITEEAALKKDWGCYWVLIRRLVNATSTTKTKQNKNATKSHKTKQNNTIITHTHTHADADANTDTHAQTIPQPPPPPPTTTTAAATTTTTTTTTTTITSTSRTRLQLGRRRPPPHHHHNDNDHPPSNLLDVRRENVAVHPVDVIGVLLAEFEQLKCLINDLPIRSQTLWCFIMDPFLLDQKSQKVSKRITYVGWEWTGWRGSSNQQYPTTAPLKLHWNLNMGPLEIIFAQFLHYRFQTSSFFFEIHKHVDATNISLIHQCCKIIPSFNMGLTWF